MVRKFARRNTQRPKPTFVLPPSTPWHPIVPCASAFDGFSDATSNRKPRSACPACNTGGIRSKNIENAVFNVGLLGFLETRALGIVQVTAMRETRIAGALCVRSDCGHFAVSELCGDRDTRLTRDCGRIFPRPLPPAVRQGFPARWSEGFDRLPPAASPAAALQAPSGYRSLSCGPRQYAT
jgi:hypothetical protein